MKRMKTEHPLPFGRGPVFLPCRSSVLALLPPRSEPDGPRVELPSALP